MLTINNELLRINNSIGISFVCGFQLINKNSLYYTYVVYLCLSSSLCLTMFIMSRWKVFINGVRIGIM